MNPEYEFEIEMGESAVGAEFAVTLEASDEVRGIPVSMGNPHYVVFVNGVCRRTGRTKRRGIQRSPEFTHGVNVELVVIDGRHDVRARFFERGVGETQSSGTGSCASAVAAMAAGRAKSPVRVHAPGGTQTVRSPESNRCFCGGSARLVCRGRVFS